MDYLALVAAGARGVLSVPPKDHCHARARYSKKKKRSYASAASVLLPNPGFDDGRWHTLKALRDYEDELSATRQRRKNFSNTVRIDNSRNEKLRRDELIPFLHLAEHLSLPDITRFRKPTCDDGVDIEYEVGAPIQRLQITTAYPLWFDAAGNPLNGGHQFRLEMEKLTAEGLFGGLRAI